MFATEKEKREASCETRTSWTPPTRGEEPRACCAAVLERASKISAAKEVSGYRPIGGGQ